MHLGDHLGSTSVTANSNGTLYAEQRYTPWGGTRGTPNPTTPTSFQYTGQRNDSSLGLYFYNARYYDPYLNRFLSPDTIVPDPSNPQSLNRYSYTINNPLKYTDPTGHEYDPWLPGGGGGSGYFGGNVSPDWQYNAYIKSEYGSWAEYYARWSESLRYPTPISSLGTNVTTVDGETTPFGTAASQESQDPTNNTLPHSTISGPTPESVLENLSKNNINHTEKHLAEFQQYDPTMTGERLRQQGSQLVIPENMISQPNADQKVYQGTLTIGEQDLTVRIALNRQDRLHSIHIRHGLDKE